MANNRLHLSREQLSQFLKNHEQIRQFERLFGAASELEPTALADLAVTAAAADTKAQAALDALHRIATAVEFLSMVPVDRHTDLDHDTVGVLPYGKTSSRVKSNQVMTWLMM